MICKKCGTENKAPIKKIYKHGKKNYMRFSCASCGEVIAENISRFSQAERIVFISLGTAAVFYLLVFLSSLTQKMTEIGYRDISLAVVLSVIFLSVLRIAKNKK